MTNYSEQTIVDIKTDIENWIEYSQDIKDLFRNTIDELKAEKYWDAKVPFGFRSFCGNVVLVCDSFITDFRIVLSAINNDNITRREIRLMQNIYYIAREKENESWKSFKNFGEDGYWHKHGNPLFKKTEKLYKEGRDYYVTLRDVSNAAARMEGYLKKDEIIIQNNTDNSIHIGNNNKINKSVISTGQQSQKESWVKKWWWSFIVPIVVAVIAGMILYYMKMN